MNESTEAAAVRVAREQVGQRIDSPRPVLVCTEGRADYVMFVAQRQFASLPQGWAFVTPFEILEMASSDRRGKVTWPAALAAYHLSQSAPVSDNAPAAQSELFALKSPRDFEIGIKSGDLLNIRNVDLWANPENTAMAMDRFDGRSVSAIVRYGGAEKDSAGNVLADTIGQSLLQQLGSRTSVPLGTVMRTTAGELAFSNDVHAILHVAAVEGQGPGMGFHTSPEQIALCMTNLLEVADELCGGFHLLHHNKSLLVPLLGAGQGGLDASKSAEVLINGLIRFVKSERSLRLRRVWFLTHTSSDAANVLRVIEPHIEHSQAKV